MRVISIEEHWLPAGIDQALRSQPAELRDDSVVLNDRGEIPERLADIGELRIAAMDAAGVDLQIVSVAPPGTNTLATAEAIGLSREANDQATEAVHRHPDRFRAMTILPMADPAAAAAELERTAREPSHVAVMAYGRVGDVPLDDRRYDELLGLAAAAGRPVFIHPQIPPRAVREASYSGIGPLVDLGLATFGWGWHLEAGLATLRLILAGTFDRHPDLQIVLGHWGELLLFWLDRVDSLSGVAPQLERRVSEYVQTNVHIASSGMLAPRLLRQALDYTTPDRILLSGDYPFHRVGADGLNAFLAAFTDESDRAKFAHANAEALFGL